MANTTFEVNKASADFQAYYQTTINDLKAGHPQYAETAEQVIIRIQFDVLWAKIPKTRRIYDYDKMSEFQKSVFNKALIQQLYYVLKEGDFSDMSGYDVSTNSFLPPEAMEKLSISKAAQKTLQDGGLLYRGLGDGNACMHRPCRRWI